MKIAFSVVLPHSREVVWAAMTNSEALSKWLMANDFLPVQGHEFVFETVPSRHFDGKIRCRVLQIDPPSRLELSWCAGSLDSTLSFLLQPVGRQTRVLLVQDGFSLSDWRAWLVMRSGWKPLLRRRLRAYLYRLEQR